MVAGRDFFVNDLLKDYKGKEVDPVALPSDAPLFLMYSSGTTGKPKGAQHGIAGYLSYVTATSKWILDIHPEDVYWCMADIGWITGHSRSEEHTSELQSLAYLVCRLLLEKKKKKMNRWHGT